MSLLPAVMAGFLIAALTVSSCSGTDAGAAETGISPLYEYRYSQAVEDLGLRSDESPGTKLEYGSIETASLSPRDRCDGMSCRLTIKADNSSPTSGDTCIVSCISSCSPSCGLNSCAEANTCGDTCVSTCSISCRGTCGYGCGRTYGGTCARSCSGTCTDTCGSNTCGSSTCAETCSASCGLASCGPATACGGDFTCGSTCSASCGGTCGYTCGVTCGYTCARTCGLTCGQTCYSTCAETCMATCGSKCAIVPVAPVTYAPLARSKGTSPPAAELSSIISYDTRYSQPASVYYSGVNMPWPAFSQASIGSVPLAWIEMSDGSWGVEASAPRGTWTREFIYVPVGGNLVLHSIDAGGMTTKNYGYATPGFKWIWFYADVPGRHESFFSVGGTRSNDLKLYAY